MSIQKLINLASTITFDRKKMVGIQYSTNEIAYVSETPTRNPWKMEVVVTAGLPYDENRDFLEELNRLDRRLPSTFTFSNNAKLDWISSYRGELTPSQLSAIRVQSFVGNQLVLTGLPSVPANTVLFKSGDFIQIGSGTTNPFPFTSVNEVTRGSGNIVTVTTHRPNFLSGIEDSIITVGSAVTFKMICTNMPSYRLVQGATKYSGNLMTNNAYIEFTDVFKLYEYTGVSQ